MKNRVDLFPDRLEHRRTIMTQQRSADRKATKDAKEDKKIANSAGFRYRNYSRMIY